MNTKQLGVLSIVALSVGGIVGVIQATPRFEELKEGFTFTYHETGTQPDPHNPENIIVWESLTYRAVRKDGSDATIARENYEGTDYEVTAVTDLKVKVHRLIDTYHQSVTTTAYTDEAIDSKKRMLVWCNQGDAKWKKGDDILGYPTVMLEGDVVMAADTVITVRRWYAPALACAQLKEEQVWPGERTLVRIAEDLKIGDPDPSIFQAPYFEELSPGQRELKARLRHPEVAVTEACTDDPVECARFERAMREKKMRIESNYWASKAIR